MVDRASISHFAQVFIYNLAFRVHLLHKQGVERNHHVESVKHFSEPETLVQSEKVKFNFIFSFLVRVLCFDSI